MKYVGTPNFDALQVNDRVDYSSYNTSVDSLGAISKVIDDNITEKMNKSPVITVLTDESTNLVVHHKLCISTRVIDPLTLQPSTFYLTDVRLNEATGKAIYNEIK